MHADALVYSRRWKTLAVLSLSLLMIGLDNTIVNVALPTLQREFEASGTALQWIVDAYLLVFAGVLLSAGTLGDRYGRKRALQAGIAVFGLASLLAAFVESESGLIAVRAVMGVGAALIMPATLSIISAVFPREERGKAIGVWAGMAAAGIGLGPLLGGLLLEQFGWSSVFLVNVPIAAVALVAGLALVPESRDPRPGAFDLPGAVLSVAALLLLVYGIVEAPARGWLDGLVLASLGAGVLFAVAFAAWELRAAEPMLDLRLFANPRFGVASLAIGVASFALLGMLFALTQYLQFAHGYSALQAGAAMAPAALGLLLGAGASNRLVQLGGTTRVVSVALVALALLLSSSLLWTPELPYWAIGLTLLTIAICMGSVLAPSTDSVMGAVPEAKAGVGSAMNDVTRTVGGALGVAVLGSAISSLYASRIGEGLAGAPPAVADEARHSIGATLALAQTLPDEQGAALHAAASTAFTDAVGIGFTAAALACAAAAVLVRRRLPARHLAPAAPEPLPLEAEAA